MFSDILSLKHNHIIGIQDSVNQPGKFLIKELVSLPISSEIHIFHYDCNIHQLREELATNKANISYYDCFPKFISDLKPEDELEKFISSTTLHSCNADRLIIVIDSLSTLLMQKPTVFVYRLLRRLLNISINSKNKVLIQIMAVLHDDTILHAKNVITHLKFLSRVWIKMQDHNVNVTIRKSSGKLSIKNYEWENDVIDRIIWNKKKQTESVIKQESNINPISTFKLTLSESEKKARDAVQLPYERHEEKDNESKSGATIIYEPDEFDDWDEEDPDNDLEFS